MAESPEEGVFDCKIFDLTVFDIPPGIKSTDVEKHFKCFGTVKDFKAFQTVAFIKFEEPSVVWRILGLVPIGMVHMIRYDTLNIRRFEFWDQSLFTDNGKAAFCFLQFDEILLDKIFSFLEPNDQFNLAKSHPKFMYYLKSLKKYQISSINLDQELFKDLKTLRNFLDCFATDIQTVTANDGDLDSKIPPALDLPFHCLKLITESCINLTSVKFSGRCISQNMGILCRSTKLRDISLAYCIPNDVHYVTITNFLNLESLDIQHSQFSLRTECLLKYQNLKHLNLFGCIKVKSESFIALCRNNPQLITLDVRQCSNINERSLNALVSNCKQIEKLKVSCISNEILKKFAELKSLSELDISYCKLFSSESLLYFLKESPQMRCVIIKDCTQIGKDFLLRAIQVLRKQTGRIEQCQIITSMEKDENVFDLIRNEPHVWITFKN